MKKLNLTFLFITLFHLLAAQEVIKVPEHLKWLKELYPTIPSKDHIDFIRAFSIGEPYELGRDSKKQQGIPEGEVIKDRWVSKKIYPGVERDYWTYIPDQYDGSVPAALIIFQDGNIYLNPEEFNANVVLDNLIHSGEIPVTIAVFLNPGERGPGIPVYGGTRNRSYEYDRTDDLYARFLLEEIIPMMQEKWNITNDPAYRTLVGYSSGGICSFNAAWHRPDQFGKVISHCGGFVNIQGGDEYISLIRKQPRKPIKVFLQGSRNDVNTVWGSLPLANQMMASSLEYADYDYKFVYGEGGHTIKHGGAIFPETLRWLWSDFPDNN